MKLANTFAIAIIAVPLRSGWPLLSQAPSQQRARMTFRNIVQAKNMAPPSMKFVCASRRTKTKFRRAARPHSRRMAADAIAIKELAGSRCLTRSSHAAAPQSPEVQPGRELVGIVFASGGGSR